MFKLAQAPHCMGTIWFSYPQLCKKENWGIGIYLCSKSLFKGMGVYLISEGRYLTRGILSKKKI